MSQTATYYYLSCTGRVDNYLFPDCRAVSPASFDLAEMEAKAKAEGWALGRKPLCKTHATGAQIPTDEVTPAKRVRSKRVEQPAGFQIPELTTDGN